MVCGHIGTHGSRSSEPTSKWTAPSTYARSRSQASITITRWNGSTAKSRDREKVMRSLKKPDTPILTGMQIFHNYVRPHEGLDGHTPSELAGIKVKGENKWLTLIQNAASHPTKVDSDKIRRQPDEDLTEPWTATFILSPKGDIERLCYRSSGASYGSQPRRYRSS